MCDTEWRPNELVTTRYLVENSSSIHQQRRVGFRVIADALHVQAADQKRQRQIYLLSEL